MVKSSGRFYSRNSTGKFPLDVTQLRTAFGLAGATAERIRSFRTDRLSRISMGEETPAPLDEMEPKLVLHLVPLNAFTTSQLYDLKPLYNGPVKGQLLSPLMIWDHPSNTEMRFNIDGIMRSEKRQNPPMTTAYTQVFRNGIIETVDVSLLGINRWNATQFSLNVEHRSFDGERYERKLVVAVKRFRELQQFLGITPPVFIMVSFLGVKGYRITHTMFERRFPDYSDAIDRTNLIIPEIMVENFEGDLGKIMKPIFDMVWNAAGIIGSPNYDKSGEFVFNDR